jgi:hypothetical protein
MTPEVLLESVATPYEDLEAGVIRDAFVDVMNVTVRCTIETLRVGNLIGDTTLSATAVASRN